MTILTHFGKTAELLETFNAQNKKISGNIVLSTFAIYCVLVQV